MSMTVEQTFGCSCETTMKAGHQIPAERREIIETNAEDGRSRDHACSFPDLIWKVTPELPGPFLPSYTIAAGECSHAESVDS